MVCLPPSHGPQKLTLRHSYSYIIEYISKEQWCHANRIRKYNERVTQAVNNSCAVVFKSDHDFGNILALEIKVYTPNTNVMTSSFGRDDFEASCSVKHLNSIKLMMHQIYN